MCQTTSKSSQAASSLVCVTWCGSVLYCVYNFPDPTRPDYPDNPTDSPTVAYLCLAFLWREWTREGGDAINLQNPCIYIRFIILISYILFTKTIDIMDTDSNIED